MASTILYFGYTSIMVLIFFIFTGMRDGLFPSSLDNTTLYTMGVRVTYTFAKLLQISVPLYSIK